MKDFRVAVVGLGAVSTEWLRILGRRDDVEVVALVDPNAALAQERRVAFELDAPIFGDVAEAIDRERVDLVIALTPADLHRSVAEAGLRAGCDVIVEKPMTADLSEAVALVAAARETGKTVAVMQNRRYHSAIRRLRAEAAAGRIGEVVDVSADMFLWHRYPNTFLTDMDSPLLRDMAIHQFDMARAITRQDAVTVQAVEWGSPTSWMRGSAAAAATFELSGGGAFSYRGSWVAEGASTTYDGSWRVGGTRGAMTWDSEAELTIETVERPNGPYAPGVSSREVADVAASRERTGHEIALEAILEALRSGDDPETVAVDNLKSLAMVVGAVESSKLRRTVVLADLLEHAGWSG